MPFSSGIFSRLYNWVNEQASPPIELSKLDSQEEDFATGLSNCMLRDGTSLPSANLDMNGKRLTNLGGATASTDAVSLTLGDGRWALKGTANTWGVGQSFPTLQTLHPTDPRQYWTASGNVADNRTWDVFIGANSWALRTLADDQSASGVAIQVGRTGVGVTYIAFQLGAITNHVDDAAAAAAGVGVGALYRNGSQLMIRVS